jgi:hypothetical protein
MLESLKLYLLRRLAGNLDAILNLFAKLDRKLDRYIELEAAELERTQRGLVNLEVMRASLEKDAQDQTARMRRAARVKSNIAGLLA